MWNTLSHELGGRREWGTVVPCVLLHFIPLTDASESLLYRCELRYCTRAQHTIDAHIIYYDSLFMVDKDNNNKIETIK